MRAMNWPGPGSELDNTSSTNFQPSSVFMAAFLPCSAASVVVSLKLNEHVPPEHVPGDRKVRRVVALWHAAATGGVLQFLPAQGSAWHAPFEQPNAQGVSCDPATLARLLHVFALGTGAGDRGAALDPGSPSTRI
jgi:hypothetical protein